MKRHALIAVSAIAGAVGIYLLGWLVFHVWIIVGLGKQRGGTFGRFQPRFFAPLARLPARLMLPILWAFRALDGPRTTFYTALDADKNEIRLIRLLPGRGREQIRCVMFHSSLDSSDVSYEALSYTWGSKLFLGKISLNGRPFSVTSNLRAALGRLRHEDESRLLWVDAICIDQSNLSERSKQVGLMKRIYSQASHVLVWLGERCPQDVITFMEEIASHDDANAWLTTTIGNPRYSKSWRAMRRLFSLNYWYRIWIVQEVVVSSKISVVYGLYHLSWQALVLCDITWKQSYQRRDFQYGPWFYDVDKIPGSFTLRMSKNGPAITVPVSPMRIGGSEFMVGPDSLNGTRDVTRDSVTTPFLELLFRHSRSHSTDHRDKIYALLGITSDPLVSGFAVDYSLAAHEVYESFVKHCVDRLKTLEIITYACPSRLRFETIQLSTWTPNWMPSFEFAEARRHLSNLTRQIPFDAARGSSPNATFKCFPKRNGRLEVQGCMIDKVVYRSSTPIYTIARRNNLSVDYVEGRKAVQDLYSRVLRFCEHGELEEEAQRLLGPRTNAFWRTIIYNRNVDGTMPPAEWAKAFEVLIHGESMLPSDFMSDSGLSSLERVREFTMPYLSAVIQVMKHHHLFITRKGLFGIQFPQSSPFQNRFVSVFLGCNYPMLIEEAPEFGNLLKFYRNKRYRLRGTIYIHGYMNGEAINDIDSSIRTLCNFTLI
ncbi:HET-domain-containing protein [Stipitochalara longipes BDJ]|nr:HET-domain-containing protein [Stipitochalara longipes BDJ]